ncbi:MAG: DUF1292 domain-containing protein [Clostridiales bacterium]|nr:DUF1292 domain-containing protein [Clostridiales bacterium]
MEDDIVELVDEYGESLSFKYVMTINYDKDEYVILTPIIPETKKYGGLEGEKVVILRVEQDKNGENLYIAFKDEDELEDVYRAYEEIVLQSG